MIYYLHTSVSLVLRLRPITVNGVQPAAVYTFARSYDAPRRFSLLPQAAGLEAGEIGGKVKETARIIVHGKLLYMFFA
jgi:hypothetical protein